MKAKLHIARLALPLLAALGFLTSAASGEGPERPPKVTIELSVVEIQTSKLRALGFDWVGIRNAQGGKPLPSPGPDLGRGEGKLFTGSEEFLAFAKALAKNDLATIHAQPMLATQSGRTASLEIGSLRVEATPTVLRDNRIQLDYALTLPLVSSQAASNPVFTCKSSIALEPGKACVITLPMPRSPDAAGKPSETEMLVIARALLGVPERLSGREPASTAAPQSR